MVRGRQVKALATKRCFRPKRRTPAQTEDLTKPPHCDQLITQYFDIEYITPVRNGSKRKMPLNVNCLPDIKIKSKLANDEFVTTKDNFLMLNGEENFGKVLITASPHRIQLRPEEELNDKTIKAEKKKQEKGNNKANHKLTEFFPVRRSVRKTKQALLREKQWEIEKLLRNNIEEGLEVHFFEGKGRGVVATRSFNQGDFVVEYSGELLDVAQAKERESIYAQDLNTGCYMYYFKHQNQQYCVDATAESGRLGRLVNHSRNGNLATRTVVVDGVPRLVLIAKESINVGDELTYDYGDRSRESLKHHPWLAF